MPVEIKELHIRVTVSGKASDGVQAAQGGAVARDGYENHGADKEALVAECVEQVFQLLQARKER